MLTSIYILLLKKVMLNCIFVYEKFFRLSFVIKGCSGNTLQRGFHVISIKIIKNFIIRNNTLDKVIKFQRVIGKKNLIERLDKVGSTTENINVRHLRSTVV